MERRLWGQVGGVVGREESGWGWVVGVVDKIGYWVT